MSPINLINYWFLLLFIWQWDDFVHHFLDQCNSDVIIELKIVLKYLWKTLNECEQTIVVAIFILKEFSGIMGEQTKR